SDLALFSTMLSIATQEIISLSLRSTDDLRGVSGLQQPALDLFGLARRDDRDAIGETCDQQRADAPVGLQFLNQFRFRRFDQRQVGVKYRRGDGGFGLLSFFHLSSSGLSDAGSKTSLPTSKPYSRSSLPSGLTLSGLISRARGPRRAWM